MNHDEDFALAIKLQEEFEREARNEAHKVMENIFSPREKKKQNKENRNRSIHENASLIDASWEYVDPTPDIHVLFMQFDKRFFWNQLKQVEVKWSPRMTQCAGLCCYEGRGGLCSIRLSLPLLKYRPRKDLVETLLHEMIHAYLFVTNNNRDRGSHGPEFHSHMYRINKEAGTNITVYHNFHEEVNLYKQHWWRCDGPCQSRAPYFGMVKRSMNRAPGPSDLWFNDHQHTCGGKFIKVREPEGFVSKKIGKGKASNKDLSSSQPKVQDIRNFFPFNGVGHSLSDTAATTNGVKNLKYPKMGSHKPTYTSEIGINTSKGIYSQSQRINNGSNVNKHSNAGTKGFTGGMLMNKGGGTLTINAKGNKSTQTSQSVPANKTGVSALSNVRTITDIKQDPASIVPGSGSLPSVRTINGPIANKPPRAFVPFGGEGHALGTATTKVENPNRIWGRQNMIKSERAVSGKVSSTVVSKTNKRFGIMDSSEESCSNSKRGAFVTDPSGEVFEIQDDISDAFPTVGCPVCNMQLKEYELNAHLDICLSSSCEDNTSGVEKVSIEDSPKGKKFLQDTVGCPVCNLKTDKEDLSMHLEKCIGNVFVEEIGVTDEESELENTEIMKYSDQNFPCPSCSALVEEIEMNNHLDLCLSGVF